MLQLELQVADTRVSVCLVGDTQTNQASYSWLFKRSRATLTLVLEASRSHGQVVFPVYT